MPKTPVNDLTDAGAANHGKRRRALIATLLIVQVAVALATILGLGYGGRPRNEPLFIVLISMACTQGSLVGIWIALGSGATPWRLMGATVGLVGFMWCLETGFPESGMRFWTYVVLAQTLGTSLVLLPFRFSGLGINRHSPTAGTLLEKQKFQFSIRTLMEWTAALAVLLGTLPMTPSEFREPFTSGKIELYSLLGVGTLLALVALWVTLGMRWPVARILVLGLTLGVAVIATMPVFPPSVGYGIFFCVCSILSLIGSLWVLRRAGYRLAG